MFASRASAARADGSPGCYQLARPARRRAAPQPAVWRAQVSAETARRRQTQTARPSARRSWGVGCSSSREHGTPGTGCARDSSAARGPRAAKRRRLRARRRCAAAAAAAARAGPCSARPTAPDDPLSWPRSVCTKSGGGGKSAPTSRGYWQRTTLSGGWWAQPVPTSSRPPRAAHRPAAARAPRTTPGCTCGHPSSPPAATRPRA